MLRCGQATLQSTAVQEYDYRLQDTQKRVSEIKNALEHWERKSEDLQQLGNIVWGAGDVVAAVGKTVKPRLSALRDTALRCRLLLEDITSLSPKNLTDEVGSSLLRAQSLAIRFPSMAAELKVLTLAAEEKEGILYSLTPQYRTKYLEPVERHVADLGDKAKQYKSVFAGARSAASLGVSAAHAWGSVASGVRDAAATAAAAAAAASAAAATFSRDSAPRAAAAGIAASTELKRRAANLLAESDELRNRLESLSRAGDVVSVSLRALGWGERSLGARPRARVSDALQEAGARADRVFGTMRALYEHAAELRRRARYSLRRSLADLQRHGDTQLGAAQEHASPTCSGTETRSSAPRRSTVSDPDPALTVRYSLRRNLADLQRHGDTQLGAAQEHVSQIRGNTLRGSELAEALAAAAAARAREHAAAQGTISPALSALRDKVARAKHAAHSIRGNTLRGSELAEALAAAAAARAREHAAAQGTISPALSALRDKVARAKHAAHSISVSLTSAEGAAVGCSRAYSLTDAAPSAARVTVTVSFATVRDGPLILLTDDTQESEKYMKLSVVKKALRLVWWEPGRRRCEGVISRRWSTCSQTHDDAAPHTVRDRDER
ncbi:hypothetical protein evm_006947 [Chilo suppressalis]|nr:hypothetical protein evm_006947 [Chilo suppressalis]